MHVRYLQHQHQGTVQLLLMPLSTAASSVKSSKWIEEEEESDCDAVPLPIQTFLWRQTNPFLGAKIGKLHEASCVTFERVVVQNILHGLSPSLSDALASVSRWKLVRAALPHVIQCCGSLLDANLGQKGMPTSLQKILYILHWMLLDAASECTENSAEEGEEGTPSPRNQGLFSLSSIQLFVYLITPLCEEVKEEDISSNIRLESGLKIWQALWQHRAPEVWCFCAPVKQRKDELPVVQFNRWQNSSAKQQSQGVYLGEEENRARRPSVVPPPKPPRSDERVLSEKRKRELQKQKELEEQQQAKAQQHPMHPPRPPEPPQALLIDVGINSKLPVTSIVRSVSEYKANELALDTRNRICKSNTANAFDISPTSENSLRMMDEVEAALRFVEDHSMSGVFCSDEAPLVQLNDICSGISIEPGENKDSTCQVVCDNCGNVVYRSKTVVGVCDCKTKSNFRIVTNEAPPLVLTRASTMDETNSTSSQQTIIPVPIIRPSPTPPKKPSLPEPRKVHEALRQRSGDGTDEDVEEISTYDPMTATFFDIAVIRALLVTHWSEQGVYWGLKYLLNRLEEVQAHVSKNSPRNRSNSLPSGEKKPSVGIDIEYQNPTWDDFQLNKEEDRSRLKVAFTDGRRKSSDNALAPVYGNQVRRASLNTLIKRERNRSDPSLNNSVEGLSIRDESGSMSNVSSKSLDKDKPIPCTINNNPMKAQYYPEALGSSNFIEKNGQISLTVIVQTINQVMERSFVVRHCELALNIADTLIRTQADQTEGFFTQLTHMVFRIYLSLGCPHGCNDGVKSQQGDFLRVKAKTVLASLEKLEQEKFKRIIMSYVEENSCQQVLDLLHSITAFCRSEFPPPESRRSSECLPSYRNKFNEREKGIEGRMVSATFKNLTTKLSDISEQLEQPENMSLLQDIRMLVNYVQEQHGNPFRRVGLSALLDAIDRNPVVESTETVRKEGGSGKSSPSGLAPPVYKGEASLRRGLFKKKEKSGQDDSDADSSPSTPRTVSSMDDAISPLVPPSALKKKSAPKLHFAFNLLKTAKIDNADDDYSDSEAADDCVEIDFSKKASRDSFRKQQMKGPVDAKGNMCLWGVMIPAPTLLSVKGILDGARRFSFLLETARPGTFPDPPLIAALLHLKSPVLARASLLLECCHFVSRCNRGQWPEWIRSGHHRAMSLGGPLANRGTPSATRRMHSLQRSAGRYFYQWALHVGEQLSKELEKVDHRDKRELKMYDSMEDYFDDALVNDLSGEKCPPCLQMIAMLLLQEITAFLRETFRTIPRAKNNKNQAVSGWDKLLSHRRWSILSNTFNAQGSISSIADMNSSIHLNDRERRISLSTAEEDSPRGSKDTIDEIVVDKKAVRPPSLSARLFSRQSTHDESGSAHGSTKSTTYVPDSAHQSGRRIAAGRQRLLKRGSPMGTQPSLESSHKRRSFRMRKASKQPQSTLEEGDDRVDVIPLAARDSLKATDEIPLQSPTENISHPNSQHGSAYGTQTAPKTNLDDDEQHMLNNLPWIKVVIKMANSFDLNCAHEGYCTSRCFQRVYRQCSRVTESLATLYGQKRAIKTRIDRRKLLMDRHQTEQNAMRRSVHSRQSSVLPRRESAMVGQNTECASKAIKALLMEKMMQEREREKEKERDDVVKKASVEQDRESDNVIDEKDCDINIPMLDYINCLVLNLVHTPLSTALKSALLLTSDQYKMMIEVSWKLLLNEDPHVVTSAASMFILACVRRPEDSLKIVKDALKSVNASERTAAIQRFYALWRNRYHVWLKMEDGAQSSFKVPPPGIDFTLPSPPIGQSQLPVVDPPWMPHSKTKIEELSLKEEEHATSQTIMTMTRTRRKQKQEMVKRAVREAEERQCEQRQQFRLRGSAIVSVAAYEPALFHHQNEPQEESEAAHHGNRHVLPVAQPLFPSSLLSAVPLIIEMLDDPQVDKCGLSVGDVAKKIIWTCIVEEPSLFLRHFLEKLTNRERQQVNPEYRPTDSYEYLMSLLRKLILRFNPLPSQVACSLLNYLFGFVMHYVRAQCDGSDKALGMALSLTWILAPNVHGIFFKDLKQTLKKEQCDQALMITANVPSAKKIIVHGPDSGLGGIPSQFPVHEDTQFQQILSDSLEFFNIEGEDVNSYYLTDTKTGQIHLPSGYVRDYYFFHRSFYPQLTLVKMDPEQASSKMKNTAFNQRFIEVGKVLLTHSILKYSPQHVIAQRIFFLHDELTHLPSFPRKSLETCFGMHHGDMGNELKVMEEMHKFTWAKLMADMFEKMENAFMFADLHLFINVVNGIMIMHCEDVLILRRCAATYISISIHFNTLFASQGFFLIMPTILRCYSQRQTNRVFCSVVEFMCRQFYLLHRKPFLLQMCGSVANILDTSSSDFDINPMKVKAKYFFNLLHKMETMGEDSDQFEILGLVPYEKPLRALDLCYRDDPNTFCVLTDALASCICVCAFAPESKRSYQMLLVMAAILPHLIKKMEEATVLQKNSPSAAKNELAQWTTLCVEIKALINSCEALARGPQRAFDLANVAERGKSFVADSPQFFDPPTTNEDENSRPFHLKEKKSTAMGWEAAEVEEQHKEQYRRPRDTLLCLTAQFVEMATPRLKELAKLTASTEHGKIPDVMDHKCHVKLSEVALSLLKIAPYDLATMSSIGLQKYFMVILPVTDWSIESNRSALNIILRRLDKTIAKIAKKQNIRRRVSWNALSNWIIGICDTLTAFPYIAHLHPLKTTAQMCLRIMVGDPCHDEGTPAAHPSTVLHPTTPPTIFCQSVLRLTVILMQALGQFSFSLELVTSVEGMGVSADRLEAVLCHLLIPLILRINSNPKETSILQPKDLSYCIQIMQNAVSPPLGKQSVAPLMSTSTLATTFIRSTQAHVDLPGRQGSVSVTDRGHSATVSTHRIVRESVCQSIYLALKVLLLCFGKLLTTMWPRIARLVKDLLVKKPGTPSAVSFVEFLLQSNLPIALLILPVIYNKVKQKPVSDQDGAWQSDILEKIENKSHQTVPIAILISKCNQELAQLKEELSMKPMEITRSYTPTMTDGHSDSSAASLAPRTAPSRQSIDRRSSQQGKKTLTTMKEGTEGTIPEDVEDDNATSSTPNEGTQYSSRVTKSPSVPLNRIAHSPRSGFGMWRSVRRKSRNVSTESESEGERSVELRDLHHRIDETLKTPTRRSTEALVLPLHDSIDASRQRFVSFSTPKKGLNGDDDDDFQIFEQHQLV
ncbi:unnamed protein product [Auanema sp. JU1783]|nr:unnamed protein product [Auanema sp. JU1783]